MRPRVPFDDIRTIEPELLLQELESGRRIAVVDVRDGEHWRRAGHIAGARHLPMRQLLGCRDELAGLECQPIVIVSEHGLRAHDAAVALTLAGFGEVEALQGGMARWLELGLPIERAQDVRRPAKGA